MALGDVLPVIGSGRDVAPIDALWVVGTGSDFLAASLGDAFEAAEPGLLSTGDLAGVEVSEDLDPLDSEAVFLNAETGDARVGSVHDFLGTSVAAVAKGSWSDFLDVDIGRCLLAEDSGSDFVRVSLDFRAWMADLDVVLADDSFLAASLVEDGDVVPLDGGF